MEAKVLALLICLFTIMGNGWYIFRIFKKDIHPTPATWLVFLLATMISSGSYLIGSKRDWITGTYIVLDCVSCFMIFCAIIKLEHLKIEFDSFDKKILACVLVVMVAWNFSNAIAANLLIQIVITLGYIPTIKSLWKITDKKESFFTWGMQFIAGTLALNLSLRGNDIMAPIYSARAIIMVSIVLILILRVKTKMKKG